MAERAFIYGLISLLLVMGCAPSSSPTSGVPSATPPAPVTVATDVPKQNDLIFIDFFAGT